MYLFKSKQAFYNLVLVIVILIADVVVLSFLSEFPKLREMNQGELGLASFVITVTLLANMLMIALLLMSSKSKR